MWSDVYQSEKKRGQQDKKRDFKQIKVAISREDIGWAVARAGQEITKQLMGMEDDRGSLQLVFISTTLTS